MMAIAKYLISIMVITILSKNVKCGPKRPDSTTLAKADVITSAFSERKTAGEKPKQGTSIRITIMEVN